MTRILILKHFRNLVIVLLPVFLIASCHKVTVGYLITEQASYQVDSLVVKSVPDTTHPVVEPNPLYDQYIALGYPAAYLLQYGIYPTISTGAGPEFDRNRRGEPWTSTFIEGVQGTVPIIVKIASVSTKDGNAEKLKKNVTIRGNGVITVPLFHDIPPARYVLSLNFSNEGYSKNIENVFTIIVR